MSKIIIDKQVILDRIAELEKPVAHYDGIYVSDDAIAQIELLEEILQQSEEYNENEAIEFAEWILQNNIEKIKTPSQAKYWETDDTLNNKFNTTQELFKIYKDARNTKKEK